MSQSLCLCEYSERKDLTLELILNSWNPLCPAILLGMNLNKQCGKAGQPLRWSGGVFGDGRSRERIYMLILNLKIDRGTSLPRLVDLCPYHLTYFSSKSKC